MTDHDTSPARQGNTVTQQPRNQNVVVVGPPRAEARATAALGGYGVATVHEAIGRRGLLGRRLRPIMAGSTLAGTAVTALCWPGDNLMIHVAVEQCHEGDVLVVATTSECHDGMFGELLATSLRSRGVAGLIIDAGVRDVAALRSMGFPVWARDICAQGTVKRTPGSVNVPITIAGQQVAAGDAIIADDDGVLVVRRSEVHGAVAASAARAEREIVTRQELAAGVLGLDRYRLRPLLAELGVEYLTCEDYDARTPMDR